jgi:membrane protease YdiL (CAAX protease family)
MAMSVGGSMLLRMSVERIRNWFWSLGKFDSIVALVIIAISALLFFRIPQITYFKGIYFNETLQCSLVGLVGLISVYILRPPTITYFGWPKVSWKSGFFILIATGVAIFDMSGGYDIKQPLRVKIAGVVSLLAIGLAEEMVNRVLIFGTLRRFGTTFAVVVSSVIFGLMHINVYLPEWSAWDAYWHVMMATGFGLFVCAIFIATRSYWVVVIFHALSDWTVVFDLKNSVGGDDYSPGILEGLWWGAENFAIEYGLLGLILLYVLRGRWPKLVIRLAIKWKLVEQAEAVTESKERKKFFSRFSK